MARNDKVFPVRSLLILCVLGGLFICSCSSYESSGYGQMVLTPPLMPGASYIGQEMCVTCHEDEGKYFQLSSHSAVVIDITEEDVEADEVEGCETCHGPGSLHAEEQGDKSKIVAIDAKTCFTCHLDIRGKFALQHHHPVVEGHMSCSDCHSMHGHDVHATGGEILERKDEKCFKCHKEQRGPFVFEHDAMREGCQLCHNPHGSISDKMLVAGQSTTCIRCHWQTNFNDDLGRIGTTPHGTFADIGRGAECIDCHTSVHGSNISGSLRR